MTRILLITAEDDDAALLTDALCSRMRVTVKSVNFSQLNSRVAMALRFDIAIINHSMTGGYAGLNKVCKKLKAISPDCGIVLITVMDSSGLRNAIDDQQYVDHVVEKPLHLPELLEAIEATKSKLKEQHAAGLHYQALRKLVPQELAENSGDLTRPRYELQTEKSILVVELKQNARMLQELDVIEYAELLNDYYAYQSRIIEQYDGEVVGYSGQGLLAVFSGFARSHLAMKSSIAMIQYAKAAYEHFAIGIGLSDGLVVAGMMGYENKLSYGLLGINVTIANKMANLAEESEIVMTETVKRLSRAELLGVSGMHMHGTGLIRPVEFYRYSPVTGVE